MALNIINAKFREGRETAWTSEQWQWDYGQILIFEGLDLPVAYEVHFSNEGVGGTSTTQIGDADGVAIPDTYFTTGETIYAWVYLHEGNDDGETEYSVVIPVKKRPQPSNATPTPVQQDVITETIAALQDAVDKSDTNVTHYPKIESGTWWVWDANISAWVDTEVTARGPQGEQGATGQTGPKGDTGEKGDKGDKGDTGDTIEETVTGTTPSITAAHNTMYKCGEVSTLTITAPATGTFGVRFTSGTTATVLTCANVSWPEWFDPSELEANRIYELTISDRLGGVMSWPT